MLSPSKTCSLCRYTSTPCYSTTITVRVAMFLDVSRIRTTVKCTNSKWSITEVGGTMCKGVLVGVFVRRTLYVCVCLCTCVCNLAHECVCMCACINVWVCVILSILILNKFLIHFNFLYFYNILAYNLEHYWIFWHIILLGCRLIS